MTSGKSQVCRMEGKINMEILLFLEFKFWRKYFEESGKDYSLSPMRGLTEQWMEEQVLTYCSNGNKKTKMLVFS